MDQLIAVLSQTLSPDASTRRQAEKYMETSSSQPGYPQLVLTLISSPSPSTLNVKQIAAVHFKNIIRKNWSTSPTDSNDGSTSTINEVDRKPIKDNLVQLMCNCPGGYNVKSQLSEAISIISTSDYPSKWTNLLPDLVCRFGDLDTGVINDVLLTLSSILKRFRNADRSEETFLALKYTLDILQAPILALLKSTSSAVIVNVSNQKVVTALFESLHLICRIFYSLNWLELPEYFEDHINEWMEEFAKYLTYTNPLLQPVDEDTPSPIAKLQSSIIENLSLYCSKDEEPFTPFIGHFTKLIWNNIMSLSTNVCDDILASTSIQFLSSVVKKKMNESLFNNYDTLNEIVSKIVIPNLRVTESDVDKFTDDPSDYILSDMEGSESSTRKRVSIELLRAMCKVFEVHTTNICTAYIQSLLSTGVWNDKDVAINLVLAVSVRSESTANGVSEVNPLVNVLDFYASHILPSLTNKNENPMITAEAIKFTTTFRNQFTVEQTKSAVTALIALLVNDSTVINTYASNSLEKILSTKTSLGSSTLKFGRTEIQPFLESMFTGYFHIVERDENEYTMKAIMRSLSIIKDSVLPVTSMILSKLTSVLIRVSKNPQNPYFNHYLFESIAVLIKYVCATNRDYVNAFESLLLPPFQTVLQMDVTEFTPYVFQILSQIVEYRTDLSEGYMQLFPPLLTPGLWESKGNIPALTRLIEGYLTCDCKKLIDAGYMLGILGVFQKLLSSRANEEAAFKLLKAITANCTLVSIQPRLTDIFNLLLMKLQSPNKSQTYTKHMLLHISLLSGIHGCDVVSNTLDAIQPGLVNMILPLLITSLDTDNFSKLDVKVLIIGFTRLLISRNVVSSSGEVWVNGVISVLKVIGSSVDTGGVGNVTDNDDNEDNNDNFAEMSFDSAYSRLHYASQKNIDVFPSITDVNANFIKELSTVEGCSVRVNDVIGRSGLGEGVGKVLEELCRGYSVQLR